MNKYLFNDDFIDFIHCLNDNEVRYMLIGGYAVILYGYTRTTGDMDIWIEPTAENYERLRQAFLQFGMPMFDMTEERFLDTERYDVFSFGRSPVCIELLTRVKGLVFSPAYSRTELHPIEDDFFVRVLSKRDLLTAKKAVNRPKDQDDIEHLQ